MKSTDNAYSAHFCCALQRSLHLCWEVHPLSGLSANYTKNQQREGTKQEEGKKSFEKSLDVSKTGV